MTPANPLKPQITKVTETIGNDPTGKAVKVLRVTYMIGTHGPFTDDFPRDGLNTADVTARIREMAQKLNEVTNA